MMPNDHRELEPLWERYSRACPEVEASANFMPAVWQRIDARRGFTSKLASYSRALTLAAASLCLAVGLFEISPLNSRSDVQLTATHYVDLLDEDRDAESLTYNDPDAMSSSSSSHHTKPIR